MDDGIRGVRRVINDLRPALLDDLGLVPAVRALADDVRQRTGIAVRSELDDALPRLGDETELALFRAAQESLANIVRHAQAREVTLRLERKGDRVRLRILDDGRGFPAGASLATFERDGHLGLVGMRERIAALGGRVEVTGSRGVTVTVEVPVERP